MFALAFAAAGGALINRPWPLFAAGLIALGGRRFPALLCVAAAVATSSLASRAHDGLTLPPPAARDVAGVATLRSDPVSAYGGMRVQLSLPDGRRAVADAKGTAASVLRPMLAGERVRVDGRLAPLSPSSRKYFTSRHVGARLEVHRLEPHDGGHLPYRIANDLRRTLARGARGVGDARRPLFLGFVLGDDRGQSAAVIDDFRASGLSHLLAVSGQNVAFVLLLATPLLVRLRLTPRLVVVFAVIALFALMTRAEPSVLRASVVAAIGALVFTMGRPISGLRTLALASTLLLLIDPLLVHSLGFVLSVAASGGILLVGPAVRVRLPGPDGVRETVAVTVAAQAGVLPVLLPTFGGVPVASLVANALAVPVAGSVMVWGLVGGFPAGLLPDPWPAVLHVPTNALVGWVSWVARTTAGLPLGEIQAPHVAAAFVAALASRFVRDRLRVVTVVAAVAAVALVPAVGVAVASRRPLDGAKLAGGGTLWRENGNTVLTVDRPDLADLLPALRRSGVRRVDVLVLRDDSDVGSLMARVKPRRLIDASDVPPGTVLAVGDLRVEIASGAVRVRSPPVRLALGTRTYDVTHRALVMGILNRTTDSFFDKGAYFDMDRFLTRAEELVNDGADVLDVGGVKAGPGPEVTEDEELERVVPAIEALAERFDVPLSCDTWRASVLDAACDVGASVGNDISGFGDPDYVKVAAKHGASVVATHIRLAPRVPDPEPVYDDLVGDVCRFLVDRARRAEEAGLTKEQVMVDAGLDLGKTWQQSLELLRASDRLAVLGYPLLLSASNKTFLGRLLDLDVGDRREASLASAALGVTRGCRIVRAHDVRGTRRVCDVVAAVLEAA